MKMPSPNEDESGNAFPLSPEQLAKHERLAVECAQKAKAAYGTFTEYAIQTGFHLLKVREALKAEGHGKWTRWVKAKFGEKVKTANNYIRAYEQRNTLDPKDAFHNNLRLMAGHKKGMSPDRSTALGKALIKEMVEWVIKHGEPEKLKWLAGQAANIPLQVDLKDALTEMFWERVDRMMAEEQPMKAAA